MRSNVAPEELDSAYEAVAKAKGGAKVTGHSLWIALGQRCSKTTTENYVRERKSMETSATPMTFSKVADDLRKGVDELVSNAVVQERERNQHTLDQKDQMIKSLNEMIQALNEALSTSQNNLRTVRETLRDLSRHQEIAQEERVKAVGVSEHWKKMYDDLKEDTDRRRLPK